MEFGSLILMPETVQWARFAKRRKKTWKNSTYKPSLFKSNQMKWNELSQRTTHIKSHSVVLCYVLFSFCSLLLLLRFYALQESASIYCDGIFNIHRASQYVCVWSFTLILKFKALSLPPDWWRRANPSTITCFLFGFVFSSMTNALLLSNISFVFLLLNSCI